jgi:hypothetical protein
MPTIRLEAQVSTEDLLKAVEQLSQAELEQFLTRLLEVRAQRLAPRQALSEAELLQRIHQGLPADVRHRYDKLIVKRQAEALTSEEQVELLHLSELVEKQEASRWEALMVLAQARQTSVIELMRDLGL